MATPWILEACVKRRLIASIPPIEIMSAKIIGTNLLVFIKNSSYLMVYSLDSGSRISKHHA
jgi:hypothetical protein